MFENLFRKMPVVLVVESRDEVYARLQAMLAEEGLAVERARCAASVPARINRFRPDVILIHAEMPYESGWLIACKLTFSHPGQTLWLYGAQDTGRLALRQHVCGVGAYIAYGGVLPRLIEQVQQTVRRWRRASPPRFASPAAPRKGPGDRPRPSAAWVADFEGIVFPLVNKETYHEKDVLVDRVVGLGIDRGGRLPIGQERA